MGTTLGNSSESPYLADSGRLADVIAAIQAMGTYKFYKLPFDGGADRITANKNQALYWKNVFEQHPEFFRLDSTRERASLVWRRQYPKRFHVDLEKRLSVEEFKALSDDQKDRVSRDPLTPGDIKALVDTAINLHSRALESEHERRWWIPLASSAIGGLIGAVLGAFLHAK
jgi:hypothetical protein